MTQNYSFIIMALAAGLALQLYFTGWQTKRFYTRLKEIRKDGLTSIGLDGGIWSGRRYAVLVVDEKKTILHAEKMSGITIFAKLKQVPVFIGLDANELLDENRTFGIKKRMMNAFRNAARELYKEDNESQSTIEDHKVKSVMWKSEKKS